MPGKDYYRILEADKRATEEQIKQAYRKLALRYHPDRNSGDPHAEERFKEISEAYGVLMDREKRTHYDSQQTVFGGGYQYRQEDVFRDMFRNPNAQDLFRELSKEFEKYGARFDQKFVNRVFFGGKGIFFGGIFFGGVPFPQGFGRTSSFGRKQADPTRCRGREDTLKGGILSRLGRKIETSLLGHTPKPVSTGKTLDIDFHLTLARHEASSGSKIKIAYKKGKTSEKLNVTIPPGTKSGNRLRLRGKGMPHPTGGPPGDLYLHINVAD
jgi:DnaJ-class molecular chaperone